jgi:hypothetical protein
MTAKQLDLFTHPARSAAKQSPTTRGAADARAESAAAIAAVSGEMRNEVLTFIRQAGHAGRTDEEVSLQLEMKLDTARARRCELRDAGLVKDSGRRRPTQAGRNAVVWILAELAETGGGRLEAGGRSAPGPAAASIPRGMPARHGPAAALRAAAPPRRSPRASQSVAAAERPGPGLSPAVASARRRSGHCPWCGGSRFWRSVADVVLCTDCHPPAAPELAAEWVDVDDAGGSVGGLPPADGGRVDGPVG